MVLQLFAYDIIERPCHIILSTASAEKTRSRGLEPHVDMDPSERGFVPGLRQHIYGPALRIALIVSFKPGGGSNLWP